MNELKDLLDKWVLKTKEFLDKETGGDVPLEIIDISFVEKYFLKTASSEENNEVKYVAEKLYLKAYQGLIYLDDPFFADVLKHIERDNYDYTLSAPAAVYMPKSDNEIHLVINPFRMAKTCNDYTEMAAVLEHECLHVLNRHLEHYLEFDGLPGDQLNICLDVAINQMINILKLPDGVIDIKAFGEIFNIPVSQIKQNQDANYYISLAMNSNSKNSQQMKQYSASNSGGEDDSNDDLDSDVNQMKDQIDKGKGNSDQESDSNNTSNGNSSGGRPSDKIGQSSGGSAVDGHGKWANARNNPGQSKDSQLDSDLIKSATDKLINDTIHNKIRGYNPAAYEGKFVDVEPPKPIDWRKYVRESMQGMQDGLKTAPWRPSRRHPFNLNFSGVTNSYKTNVYTAIDTSGSLSDEELSSIILEIFRFAKTFEANFTVLECDAKIQDIHHVRSTKDLAKLKDKIKGRGGTSYLPVFDYLIRKQFNGDQDILLYFTDGYGENNDEVPDYIFKKFDPAKIGSFKNVIWVITRYQDDYNSRNKTPAEDIKIGRHVSLILNDK